MAGSYTVVILAMTLQHSASKNFVSCNIQGSNLVMFGIVKCTVAVAAIAQLWESHMERRAPKGCPRSYFKYFFVTSSGV
ncbi:hypothetical protein JKP88DRAFT_235291 [Tribonema minus]|uniref:Uncharacterized protein n=1 Tax=Tribonema minus TaxID=303371 RepID=A0A835Z7R9_9STRA|nr:hypothetical protein JKP88DRAFT_235291 [Tribonema minus]